MARRTSPRMRSNSAAFGGRSSNPTSCTRTVVAPMNDATLVAMPLCTRCSRYSLSVVQGISNSMSPCCSSCSARMLSFTGPMEEPSPKTSSVTPCRMSPCERPSSMRDSVAQLSMLMKPGATASPDASISILAEAALKSPRVTMVSPAIAMSSGAPSAPVPSYTVPPRMITS